MTYIYNEQSNSIIQESVLTTTNSSSQVISTTRQIINGSQIQYTPDASATHVLYQCSFQWTNQPDANTHFYISLVEKTNISDSWSYIANKSFAISINDSASACSFENIELLIPTWSGSKYLGLYIRSHLSSTEGRLHQLKMDDTNFNTGNENFINTFTTCTSIKSEV